jgi:hypothetical protein
MAEGFIAVDFILGPMDEYWLFYVIPIVVFYFDVVLASAHNLEPMSIFAFPQKKIF